MTKLWTPEQRMEAISRVAHLGYKDGDIELFIVIGALTNGSVELLNTDTEIQDVLKDAGVV